MGVPFVHLHVHSPFSFLDGASNIQNLVQQTVAQGMDALAITDHFNVSASILFTQTALSAGIKPIIGAEVTLTDKYHLTLIAQNSNGYENICKIITAAYLYSDRTCPKVKLKDIIDNKDDLIIMSGCRNGEISRNISLGLYDDALTAAEKFKSYFGNNFYIELQNNLLPHCNTINKSLVDLASHLKIRYAATANAHYSVKEQFRIHDLLTCIRTHTTLEDVHPERSLNAEHYLYGPEEAASRFKFYPDALLTTRHIADCCEPPLKLDVPMFPKFHDIPPGMSAMSYLRELVYRGARIRYGKVTRAIEDRLDHELNIIGKLGFEDYFLFVWDVARYAKELGVRYAGRGSAADSAVAYCLFITSVDSISRGLLFERFMSLERAQRPDIDIDFDARLRDDVTAYIYEKYGQGHVATVCTFSRYHARSAIREMGKAMGIPLDEISTLAKRFPHIASNDIESALSRFPELRDSDIQMSKYEQLFDACDKIAGFPRHMGTHLGGVVVSREPLTRITPLQSSAKGVLVTQFDKDYIEDLGLVKLDLLCLRTLSAVDDANEMIVLKDEDFKYDVIPLDDLKTYETLNSGQTIGVFQLESPAQRALQPRLKADNIEDIVASVALIRPGPIEGNMVEPFIARRQGKEQVSYLHPKLRPILEKTYGVVLFQEQVIEIATAIAGFTPGEADKLRKVMTHARSRKDMDDIGTEFINRAIVMGVEKEIAKTIYSYIVGYAGYGFCEAHAAAFADTAFKTAYLVTHYPAEFYAAILNNEPMGFYPPHTICVEAKRRGVSILGPDINNSNYRYVMEDGSIRVPLKQVKGITEAYAQEIIGNRDSNGPFLSINDFCRRVRPNKDSLEAMVLAGCFDSLHHNRRNCLWTANRVVKMTDGGGLLDTTISETVVNVNEVVDYTKYEKMQLEYRYMGISAGGHIMSYYRHHLNELGIIDNGNLEKVPVGKWVKVAGLLIRPHRPPTRSGKTVVFFALEDEAGLCDVTVFESVYNKFGSVIYSNNALIVEGRLDGRGKTNSVIASRIRPIPFTEWNDVN